MKIDLKAENMNVHMIKLINDREESRTEILMRVLIARLLATVAFWVRDIPQKYKMGDISKEVWKHILPRQKTIKNGHKND